MDIEVYENIKDGLKSYFETFNLAKSFTPSIVGFEPSSPTYPMVILTEPRNVPYDRYNGSLETVANLGYRFDIYAKTSGSNTKQLIARTLAKYCDDFARNYVDLKQVSWNEIQNEGSNGQLYHIIIMYTGTYYEQKLTFM